MKNPISALRGLCESGYRCEHKQTQAVKENQKETILTKPEWEKRENLWNVHDILLLLL